MKGLSEWHQGVPERVCARNPSPLATRFTHFGQPLQNGMTGPDRFIAGLRLHTGGGQPDLAPDKAGPLAGGGMMPACANASSARSKSKPSSASLIPSAANK
jgi:hypothetical protein